MTPAPLCGHPIEILRALEARFGPKPLLSFARYRYIPALLLDERERFHLPLGEADEPWLQARLASLQPGEDLALESIVELDGQTLHIPMLDLDGVGPGRWAALKNGLREQRAEDGLYYFSGRSFHAYFPDLIDSQRWLRFMAEALLCASPEAPSPVDARWVGHRLLGSRGALRWSRSGEPYKRMPQRVEPRFLDHPDPESALSPSPAPGL